jgi:hypothetical protein
MIPVNQFYFHTIHHIMDTKIYIPLKYTEKFEIKFDYLEEIKNISDYILKVDEKIKIESMLFGLQKLIDIEIEDKDLLIIALTRPDISNINNYERLEFLGDSVLKFLTNHYLFHYYSNKKVKFLCDLKNYLGK